MRITMQDVVKEVKVQQGLTLDSQQPTREYRITVEFES